LAVWSAQRARAHPAGILCMLAVVTAIVSALLDNVTTVLLIAPVTLSIAQRLRVPPFPFLFAEIMASNIGAAATLIGDPPNIMIGSASHLSFNDFLQGLTPVIVIVMLVQTAAVHFVWGRDLTAAQQARDEVMAMQARSAVADARLLKQSLAVF